MEKWSRQGVENVEIVFYDGGYTKLKAGIDNMKNISRILVIMGLVLVLMVLSYFTWLFIIRQGERTAIERCLGFSRKKCFLSLFTGIFLLIAAGSVCGCMAGSVLSSRIAGGIGPASYYDLSFSNGRVSEMEEKTEEEIGVPLDHTLWNLCGILLTGSLIAGAGIWLNLREEPMELLQKRGE